MIVGVVSGWIPTATSAIRLKCPNSEQKQNEKKVSGRCMFVFIIYA